MRAGALIVVLAVGGCTAPAIVDAGMMCRAATTLCGTTCANLKLDDSHCGACGHACPEEEACGDGKCWPRVCPDFDCTSSYVCLTAKCTEQACVGVLCPNNEACLQGVCLPAQCDAGCPPNNACRAGACIELSCLGVLCPPSQYCENGACLVPCVAGESCTSGDACRAGVTACDGGMSSCQPAAPLDAGTACGAGGVCDGDGGCGGCNAGAACAPGATCTAGVISCGTGSPVCASAGLFDAGTPCDGGLCSAAGQCVPGCGDPYWANVVLLMHFDHSTSTSWLEDSSSKHHPFMLKNGAQESSVQSRFGGSSARFSNNAYLTTPDSDDFSMGGGDFTVEAWVFRTGMSSTTNTIVGQYPNAQSSNKAFTLEANTAFELGMRYTASGLQHTEVFGTVTAPVNQWRHVAATRRGTTIRIFVDGVPVAIGMEARSLYNSSAELTIGGTTVANNSWAGHLDEVRITKGVARYLGTFTPPTAPFPTCP